MHMQKPSSRRLALWWCLKGWQGVASHLMAKMKPTLSLPGTLTVHTALRCC